MGLWRLRRPVSGIPSGQTASRISSAETARPSAVASSASTARRRGPGTSTGAPSTLTSSGPSTSTLSRPVRSAPGFPPTCPSCHPSCAVRSPCAPAASARCNSRARGGGEHLRIRTGADIPRKGQDVTTITRDSALLTDDMLARFDERAPVYDRENRFFTEDFEELRASGYLLAAVPAELGGSGLRLDEVMRLQQQLAYHAPATAVAVNMHLYWTGLAA